MARDLVTIKDEKGNSKKVSKWAWETAKDKGGKTLLYTDLPEEVAGQLAKAPGKNITTTAKTKGRPPASNATPVGLEGQDDPNSPGLEDDPNSTTI